MSRTDLQQLGGLHPNEEASQIHANGLRYLSKPIGSPFGSSPGRTMSCFLCGSHRPRAFLRGFRVAGSLHYRCDGGCNQ